MALKHKIKPSARSFVHSLSRSFALSFSLALLGSSSLWSHYFTDAVWIEVQKPQTPYQKGVEALLNADSFGYSDEAYRKKAFEYISLKNHTTRNATKEEASDLAKTFILASCRLYNDTIDHIIKVSRENFSSHTYNGQVMALLSYFGDFLLTADSSTKKLSNYTKPFSWNNYVTFVRTKNKVIGTGWSSEALNNIMAEQELSHFIKNHIFDLLPLVNEDYTVTIKSDDTFPYNQPRPSNEQIQLNVKRNGKDNVSALTLTFNASFSTTPDNGDCGYGISNSIIECGFNSPYREHTNNWGNERVRLTTHLKNYYDQCTSLDKLFYNHLFTSWVTTEILYTKNHYKKNDELIGQHAKEIFQKEAAKLDLDPSRHADGSAAKHLFQNVKGLSLDGKETQMRDLTYEEMMRAYTAIDNGTYATWGELYEGWNKTENCSYTGTWIKSHSCYLYQLLTLVGMRTVVGSLGQGISTSQPLITTQKKNPAFFALVKNGPKGAYNHFAAVHLGPLRDVR